MSEDHHEILPNLLGLETAEEIALSEFEGFLKAEIVYTESLSKQTAFTVSYILGLHKFALEHLYAFAGKLRNKNISKGGFPFPAGKYLPQAMTEFENEVLSKLPNSYKHKDDLIRDIAIVHGELLFIHPFREGNGRTSRIIANLMARKQGYDSLHFELIDEIKFLHYVSAVQESASKDYSKMIDLMKSIFPN